MATSCRFDSGLRHQAFFPKSVHVTRSLSTRTAWFIFILLVALLIAGTTMPSDLMNEIESQMWRKLPWAKLAHYTLFALIGMCPVYGTGRAAVWRTILVGVGLAVLTELLQSLVPGRHPQLRDVGIDLGGTGLALLLGWLRRKRTDCT
jgi:VanZ family protein